MIFISIQELQRNQIQDDDIFFADELVIQTAHKPVLQGLIR